MGSVPYGVEPRTQFIRAEAVRVHPRCWTDWLRLAASPISAFWLDELLQILPATRWQVFVLLLADLVISRAR